MLMRVNKRGQRQKCWLMAVWDCLRGCRVETGSAGSPSALKTNGGAGGELYCGMAAAVPWDYSELAAPGAVVNSITRV